jgi:RNA polymerase sigma-70 factor (ECF subfamily)
MALLDDLRRRRRDRRHTRWLLAARSGDERAFVRLYRELYDPVADYFAVRCPQPQDAEDLTAIVFHRFLDNMPRFDSERGSVLSWVLTIARHALIDDLRRRRSAVPVDELEETLAGRTPDPLDGLIKAERAARLRCALERLPAAVREMLALHYAHDLRLREIGELMGLSADAVKQRFARARRELRAQLESGGPVPRPCPVAVGRHGAPRRAVGGGTGLEVGDV